MFLSPVVSDEPKDGACDQFSEVRMLKTSAFVPEEAVKSLWCTRPPLALMPSSVLLPLPPLVKR